VEGQPVIVDELRARGIDHVRARRWEDLLELQSQLELDNEYWLSMWGPACAVAAYHLGHADARDLLVDLVDAGFYDLVTHQELFAETFESEPDWPQLRARMLANMPAPPVELLDWPTATPTLPVSLDRLDSEAASRLATRLPAPAASAQETALALLAWVTSRWRHIGTKHVAGRDANLILDRVEQGERFACREYTIVLTQSLNALGIPARPMALFRPDYHAGLGTGHAVTEAWLDELGRWVVLDGQNGAT